MSIIMFYLLMLLFSPSIKSIRWLPGLLDFSFVFFNFFLTFYIFAWSSKRFFWFHFPDQKLNLNLCPIYYSIYLVKFLLLLYYLNFENSFLFSDWYHFKRDYLWLQVVLKVGCLHYVPKPVGRNQNNFFQNVLKSCCFLPELSPFFLFWDYILCIYLSFSFSFMLLSS